MVENKNIVTYGFQSPLKTFNCSISHKGTCFNIDTIRDRQIYWDIYLFVLTVQEDMEKKSYFPKIWLCPFSLGSRWFPSLGTLCFSAGATVDMTVIRP